MENPLPHDERIVVEPLVGSTMLELGNKRNPLGVYKHYFESLGIKHTSVDWNGEDGALRLDLRQPLNLGQFDMVTNIGTTEHVSEQIPVWENIHTACALNGIVASITPAPDNWWWHGEYYPKIDFFKEFALLNGYQIEVLTEAREYPNINVCARLRKIEDKPFTMPANGLMVFNHRRPR